MKNVLMDTPFLSREAGCFVSLLPPWGKGWEGGEENIIICIEKLIKMKENLNINLKNTSKFISFEEIVAHAQQSVRHLDTLNNRNRCREMIFWDGYLFPMTYFLNLKNRKNCKTSKISF
jgi:hypothetical protein